MIALEFIPKNENQKLLKKQEGNFFIRQFFKKCFLVAEYLKAYFFWNVSRTQIVTFSSGQKV